METKDVRRLAICYSPQPDERAVTAETAWRDALQRVLSLGREAAPRGLKTKELLHASVTIDTLQPVVTCAERGLGYTFMATEALWIIDGRNDLATLAKVLPRYASYSDDGETLNGAYGPKVMAQLDWIVGQLLLDPDTRQATMTIWERTPAPSKDVPCTVALSFSLRQGRIHCHSYMRSSDVWRGLPYDLFSFSVITWLVATRYNKTLFTLHANQAGVPLNRVLPGNLTVTATSSHLYEPEWASARAVLQTRIAMGDIRNVAPVIRPEIIEGGCEQLLRSVLKLTADGGRDLDLKVRP